MVKNGKKKGGLAAKLTGVAASAILAASMAPGLAFADAGATSDGGWFDLPTESIDSFTHDGNANGNAYSYQYLSSGVDRVVGGFSQSMYYIMGVNGMNFDRGLRNNQPWSHVSNNRLTVDHVTAVDGIMGTSVNIAPDEYLWNSCVKLNSASSLADLNNTTKEVEKDGKKELAVTDDLSGIDTKSVWINAGNIQSFPTVAVEIDGTPAALHNVIYYEANFISSSDATWVNGADSILEEVALENQLMGRSEGDADYYNPYIASWETNSGGINYGVELMYGIADAIDAVTDESKDANGNATVMSRYVNANGDNKGDYDSALAIAQRYEDFAKATQYYMIGKINKGMVDKKVSATICGYQPAKDGKEAAYACRIYDTNITGDQHDSSAYGGRIANSIMNFSTDINTVLSESDIAYPAAEGEETWVRWYWASDIAKNADAIFVTDVPEQNRINTYLATNNDGEYASIYSVDNTNYPKANENVNALVNACAADDAKADLYYKYPAHLFGVWYAQGFENCWMAPLAAAYMYGDAFTSPENVMAYAAKNFWHINESAVNGVVAATCYDISMPAGASFGTPDSDYQAVIDDLMVQGNGYYLSSRGVNAGINAMNGGDLVTYDMGALNERTPDVTIESENTAMHRLYNQFSGEHFYTADDEEWGNLVAAGWIDEGTGWLAPDRSNTPVYRLYNEFGAEHHYTMDADERDALVAVGWTDEGIGWYSDDDMGTVLYRDYNPNEFANNHNYTANLDEHNNLMRVGWMDEGTAWYGLAQ